MALEEAGRINTKFSDLLRQLGVQRVAKKRQFGGWWVATIAVALLGGCAMGLSKDSSPEAKREAVSARAQARWQALIKGDLDSAYTYMSPPSRATMPRDVYKAKHKVGLYRAVRLDSVECELDACRVKLSLTYDYKQFKGITTPLVEKWVIYEGQAWFVDQG